MDSHEDSSADSDEMDDDEDITVSIYNEDENTVQESSSHLAEEEILFCDDGLSEEDRKYLSDMFSCQPDADGLGGADNLANQNEVDDSSGNVDANSNAGKDMIGLSDGCD